MPELRSNLIIVGGCESIKKIPSWEMYQSVEHFKAEPNLLTMEEVEQKSILENKFDNGSDQWYNLIVFGGTNSSGIVLKILERIKDCVKHVFFVIPNETIIPITKKKKMQSNIAFKVLQEYARSGVINSLMMIENSYLEKKIDVVNVDSFEIFYDRMNQHLLSLVENIVYCWTNKPVNKNTIERIMSLSIITKNKKEEETYPLMEETSKELVIFGPKNWFQNHEIYKEIVGETDDFTILPLEREFVFLFHKTKIIQ